MFNDDSNILAFGSNKNLSLNTWQHLAFVFSFPYSFIYIDGELTGTGQSTSSPLKRLRDSNFIGRSNWYPLDDDADFDLDELKIYKKALSQSRNIK